ncbi:MAG: DUF4928 family protein [Blastocatellia bacterium]
MSRIETARLAEEANRILTDWLAYCTRGKKVSRNTLAVGIVVLDHLRRQRFLTKEDLISQGGEVKGARSGLGDVLERYGIPRTFLKEVTTRQASPDAQKLLDQLEWGNLFSPLRAKQIEQILVGMIAQLRNEVTALLMRDKLKIDVNRRDAPAEWIRMILQSASGRSTGIVEQHLVGAKLQRRFPRIEVANHPSHAGDVQTLRKGDFLISNLVYHVTANPSRGVIEKCAANIKAGLSALLVIPHEKSGKARVLAEEAGIGNELTIVSLEDFLALNIIELGTEEEKDLYSVLTEIIEIYNQRFG